MDNILKINLSTGTAWTSPIYVKGDEQDDLLALIDEHYSLYGLPVPTYTCRQLVDVLGKEEAEQATEEMLPINGGEVYIDGIEYVEEVDLHHVWERHLGLTKELEDLYLEITTITLKGIMGILEAHVEEVVDKLD